MEYEKIIEKANNMSLADIKCCNDDNIKFEGIRHYFSRVLSAHYGGVQLREGFVFEERFQGQGLSSLDMPWVTEVCESTDGVVFFILDGGIVLDLDDLTTEEAIYALECFLKETEA